jgi:hypothetical protein
VVFDRQCLDAHSGAWYYLKQKLLHWRYGALEAVRKIIDARRLAPIIELPEHMRGSRVELIILALPAETAERESRSMKGALHAYANPALAELEKTAWGSAVAEKYVGS